MEKFDDEFSKALVEKLGNAMTNIDIKQLQIELLSLYFGKGWAEKLANVLMSTNNATLADVDLMYGSTGENTSIIPSRKDLIFSRFANVPFEKIKQVLLSEKPGIIEDVLGSEDLSQLEKQGVFILTHELTAAKAGHESIYDSSGWRVITTEVHGLLTDFEVVEVTKNTDKEELLTELERLGIVWKD